MTFDCKHSCTPLQVSPGSIPCVFCSTTVVQDGANGEHTRETSQKVVSGHTFISSLLLNTPHPSQLRMHEILCSCWEDRCNSGAPEVRNISMMLVDF